MKLEDIKIKIFADCADIHEMIRLSGLPYIKGFTTNPTLMRKAGVTDYEGWAKTVLESIPDKPISFEVIADDFDEIERQARKIASWGENVYVKIPITNTKGQPSTFTIHRLSCDGIKVNVTAVLAHRQVKPLALMRATGTPSIFSFFVGRINDTGEDTYRFYKDYVSRGMKAELLWASTREIYNIKVAEENNFDIITLSPELLAKLPLLGKDLEEYSLETVKQFRNDALAAGYTL